MPTTNAAHMLMAGGGYHSCAQKAESFYRVIVRLQVLLEDNFLIFTVQA